MLRAPARWHADPHQNGIRDMDNIVFNIIGNIRSPYREKFGTPRQPGLVAARSLLTLRPPYDSPDAVRGLETFSHLWISFVFHQTAAQGWQPLVRPPRLGGNNRVGVFASRSSFRPNPLGLSLVRLESVEISDGVRLWLSGADLIDGTPVLDIKPYIPFVESQPDARGGFVDGPPPCLPVQWSETALRQAAAVPQATRLLMAEVLAQDPRPAYQDDGDRVYGVLFERWNVRFRVENEQVLILAVEEMA